MTQENRMQTSTPDSPTVRSPIWAPDLRAVNWRQVGAFLALTFGITWLLNLLIFLRGGLESPAALLALMAQMLVPAFAALLLGTFFFQDSPLFFRANRSRVRWFTYYFMGMSVLIIIAAVLALFIPALISILSMVTSIPVLVGLLVLIVVRLTGGKQVLAEAGMPGGRFGWWLIFALGFIAFFALQALLNALFNLGQPGNLLAMAPPQMAGMPPAAVHGLVILNSIIIGPFANLLFFFGEEYGWRGYLQGALERMGRVPGVLLVGLIWGVWHAPVILMGYNYPGTPVLGVFLMILFCVLVSFVLAYAVYKSGGVWTAAYLHGILNNAAGYFMGVVYMPKSAALSFGMGVPGLVMMGLVVLLILRDPLWRQRPWEAGETS